MSRRVCLAIAVGDVVPRGVEESRFAYLDGAPFAAKGIGEWALGSGFGTENVRVVTDERLPNGALNPVTTQRVQAAVNALFPDNVPQTDHLILSFCGHGLTAELGSTFWLFSDSLQRQYRVNVDTFINELLTFGIKRISLISDACRDAPRDLDLMRLDSVRGITGRSVTNDSPRFDRLAACQDGQKTYMVGHATSAAPGKCILSGVVLDVLWGQEPAAFIDNVINTHSFCDITRERASQRANGYGFKLHPQCSVDPRPVLLVDGSVRPAPVLTLQPWPPAATANLLGATAGSIASTAPPDDVNFELLHFSKGVRDTMLGADFGTSHPDIDASSGFTRLPDDARSLVKHLFSLRQQQHTADPRIDADISSTISALEGKAASRARAAAAELLRASLSNLSVPHDVEGGDLIVDGGNVLRIYSDRRVLRKDAIHFRAETSSEDHGTQTVVEFDDGALVPVYLYPRLFAVLVRNPNGMTAVAYGGPDDVLRQSTHAITELTLGTLNSASIEDLAALIRMSKHSNPVLGTIAAYLYRQVSDFDNIRRIAYYYVQQRQPVPFDIALLGQMDVYHQNGRFYVRVPAVALQTHEVEQRSPLPSYVTAETPAVTGVLAGRCPWLTLGWDYPPGDLFRDNLYEHNREAAGLLRPSPFTTLAPELGARLVALWNLKC